MGGGLCQHRLDLGYLMTELSRDRIIYFTCGFAVGGIFTMLMFIAGILVV
jgi:hypothetical protein